MSSKVNSLRNARNLDAVCKLKNDNFQHGQYGIMSDGQTVWLFKQQKGKPCTDTIAIPKRAFDRLHDFYGCPQPRVRAQR